MSLIEVQKKGSHQIKAASRENSQRTSGAKKSDLQPEGLDDLIKSIRAKKREEKRKKK